MPLRRSRSAPLPASLQVLWVGLSIVGLGCADRPAEPAPPSSSTPRVVISPDAIPEGTIDAFGLALPARSSLKKRSPISVSVEVPASLDATVSYLRERVVIGEERRVTKRLFLEDVALRARPDAPRLRIALRALTASTEVVVSVDASPTDEPPTDEPTTDEPTTDARPEDDRDRAASAVPSSSAR